MRISFFDISKVRVDEYRVLLKDAYIYQLNQTKEGRDYLDKCWILEQTQPDRQKLRKRFGKEAR